MTDAELDALEAAAKAATPMYIGQIPVSFNTWYYWMSGFAYIKGYENFETLFPKARIKREVLKFIKKEGMNVYKKYFHDYILFRLDLENNMPECSADCPYRIMPEPLPPQRNALRIDWAGERLPRCGARLKYDPYQRYPQYEYCKRT